MRTSRWAIAGAVALSAVFATSGCTASVEDLGLPEQNQAEWVLPLDAYAMNETENSQMYFAWTQLSLACMATAGYPLNAPTRAEPPLSESESWNSVGRYLLNEETAQKFGYHVAPSGDPQLNAEWKTFKRSVYDEAEQAQLSSCQNDAWSKLPDKQGADDKVRDYQYEAASRADESDAVEGAETKWVECMLPLGISDLPSSPTEMPSTTQLERFGLAGDESGSPTDLAGVDEIREASVDASCRTSSGYLDATYTAEWDEQVKILTENIDDLQRSRNSLDTFNSAVEEVLSSQAPAA